ncbi:MAG: helix-turn-helix domain-containing protein [Sphingomonas sp.]|uniref:helix-turn-helix domain-containing protein n=1 Tax=Sphingomonas sp. TaxID=28214 RepID=UPI0025DE9670|nr:helix-turn-helix transcriptional regulator [Sphingomonas sp.]MBY0282336.1 helix-turn-helix domain-containing protein [Sphingomonas sp.]
MATTDNYAASIVDRKRQIRAQFSTNIARLLDDKHMKQSTLCDEVTLEFGRMGVLKDERDPNRGWRSLQPWELSRWARGQVTPDPVAIAAIAKVLGVQPDDIVHGVTAESDPNAIVFTTKQMGDRFFWEFKGTVDVATHSKLLAALTERYKGASSTVIRCARCGDRRGVEQLNFHTELDGSTSYVCDPCHRSGAVGNPPSA